MGSRVSFAALAAEDDVAPPLRAGARPPLVDTEHGPHRTVPIDDVALNPLNARDRTETGWCGDDEIEDLADSIRAHGVVQPPVVCSTAAYLAAYPDQAAELGGASWVVLAGNRRLLAALAAGLDHVDVVVHDGRVASMWEVMLVENGQRRDLPPLREARAIAAALEPTPARPGGLSQRQLAQRIGRSPMYVSQRLALLRLVPELASLLEAGALTVEQGRDLGVLDPDEQRAIAAAGPPYRRGVHGVYTARAARPPTIRIGATPAGAAESLRSQFGPEQLAELIQLLTAPAAGPLS